MKRKKKNLAAFTRGSIGFFLLVAREFPVQGLGGARLVYPAASILGVAAKGGSLTSF